MGKGGQKSETSKQAPTRKTKAAVDRRQNYRMFRQCPSSIAQRPPHHAIAVPTAVQNRVTKTMSVANSKHWFTTSFFGGRCRKAMLGVYVRSSADGKQLKQKKSNSLSPAQHHLPALDLFWASFFVRVQLTSLLLISPGLCWSWPQTLCFVDPVLYDYHRP